MTDFRFMRIGFIMISALLGSQILAEWTHMSLMLRIGAGAAAGSLLVLIEAAMHRIGHVSVRGFSAAVFGILFGLLMAKLVSDAISLLQMDVAVMAAMKVVITWCFCYLGMAIALRGRDEFAVIIPYVRLTRQDRGEELYLVDTSAVIDGRIYDLCKTRFIEGKLVVPRFILKELQAVADSSDPIKRSRGRRGLDILNQLRQLPTIEVRIHEEDFPHVPEVDAKLVKLSKLLGTRIITTDYNLNKVAEFQGVPALNVNELAQALRPVVLPGEILHIKPIKEGKESSQSVAYLDDGTMVVVENGRGLIGKQVQGVVTSVLQTAAGRMVFVRAEGGLQEKK